jgi:hypothetical protein
MHHEIEYPYIPGKAGFNMKQILTVGYSDRLPGESGRMLSIEIERPYIRIEDVGNRVYCLIASVDVQEKIIGFDIQTKVPWYEWSIPRSKGRHADLFARQFVSVAFDYFTEQKLDIDVARGYWLPESDSYRTYMKLVAGGLGSVEAAKRTWTGTQYVAHGYRVLQESDIFQTKNMVSAKFHR